MIELTPTLKNSIISKLEEINKAIKHNYLKQKNVGVLAGFSGLSLFLFEYANYKASDKEAELGSNIIAECDALLNNNYTFPTYCSGIAGYGWVLDYLSKKNYIEFDNDNYLKQVDSYLFGIMQRDFTNGNYDFLHGAIGYGIYFLKRYKSTTSKELKKQYKNYVERSIIELENLSEVEEGGKLKWISILDIETGEKGYNLSLSHGMSSIINYLSRLWIIEDFQPQLKKLLNGATQYILQFENYDKGISLFPSWIQSNKTIQYNGRVAWCYGDLGIGISLYKASKALNNSNLKSRALNILIHSAKRRNNDETLIKDAGICHGAFGNAQIFISLYKETKEEDFKNAALFWLTKGLQMDIHQDGYAGYKQWRKDKWTSEVSVLEGVAGIGLTLIEFLSTEKTGWDKCLLIS